MKNRLGILCLHVFLLLLASTNFTLVTFFGDGQWRWEYFRYASQRSWGVPYQFQYSLAVVLVYIAAYATGVAAYCLVYRSGSKFVGLTGLLLCLAGLGSFSLELTHWLFDHGRTWIASVPIALLALAPVVAILEYRRRTTGRIDEAGFTDDATDSRVRM